MSLGNTQDGGQQNAGHGILVEQALLLGTHRCSLVRLEIYAIGVNDRVLSRRAAGQLRLVFDLGQVRPLVQLPLSGFA
jgi:hypothetical protein